MSKLCGPKEDCFIPGECWGHLSGVMCEHIREDESNITWCDKDGSVENYVYSTEEEYLAARKEWLKGPYGFETSQAYEGIHYSKRLIKVLDEMSEEDLYEESLWANRRHSEMSGLIWGQPDKKGCFH
jgi:hypothetical protein